MSLIREARVSLIILFTRLAANEIADWSVLAPYGRPARGVGWAEF